MGHVLLAGLSRAELEAFFVVAKFDPLTDRTVTVPDVLRAELAKVTEQGWAMVDQELEEGLRSVAAPIHDRRGRVVAAVNLSTHASRTTAESVERDLVLLLLETARAIEADLAIGAPGRAHA